MKRTGAIMPETTILRFILRVPFPFVPRFVCRFSLSGKPSNPSSHKRDSQTKRTTGTDRTRGVLCIPVLATTLQPDITDSAHSGVLRSITCGAVEKFLASSISPGSGHEIGVMFFAFLHPPRALARFDRFPHRPALYPRRLIPGREEVRGHGWRGSR